MKEFGLSKKERIKRKRDFSLVFTKGKIISSDTGKLKAIYYTQDTNSYPIVKFAAAVHRKSGTAVWRNRVKRLLKESYRLNKNILFEKALKDNKDVLLVLSSKSINQKKYPKLFLKDIMPEVIELMEKIKDRF